MEERQARWRERVRKRGENIQGEERKEDVNTKCNDYFNHKP